VTRNVWAALIAAVAVVVVLVLGFRVLGGPGTQRQVQADLRTVRALAELAQQIKSKWNINGHVLPTGLDGFPKSATQDPTSAKPFVYRTKGNSQYELCAIFGTNSEEAPNSKTADSWSHPAGSHCFPLDASQDVAAAPYYY